MSKKNFMIIQDNLKCNKTPFILAKVLNIKCCSTKQMGDLEIWRCLIVYELVRNLILLVKSLQLCKNGSSVKYEVKVDWLK